MKTLYNQLVEAARGGKIDHEQVTTLLAKGDGVVREYKDSQARW